jgi:ATP/maltotriose-dependent transcriptional regulator MalT
MTLIVLSDVVHGAPEAKIQPPILRTAPVQRARLRDRLAAVPDDVPLVLLTAPAGYGKTTVLNQWAAVDRRRFGWVTLDRADSDPVRLADHVALALDRMGALDHGEVLDSGVLRALAAGNASSHVLALPHLLASLCRRSRPGVLVLDDFHELANVEAMNFIAALAAGVPPGFHIAIGARLGLSPVLARLRSQCRCVEFGPDDLAFTEDEARQVLAVAGVACSGQEVAAVVRRTEGWPAGVYLSALALRAAPGEELRVHLRAAGWSERRGRPEDGVVHAINRPDRVAATAARTSRLSARLTRAGGRPRIRTATTLSAAELRVLELLPTHLSLREIGDQLYISRNTVKSQVAAIYQRLGCSTRTEVVRRGRDLGLLEP